MQNNHLRRRIISIIILILVISLPNTLAGDNDSITVTFSFYGPIWDINHDGIDNYLDVSSMVSHYGESNATAHWIRDDMNGIDGNPDGEVNYLDVSLLVTHYGEVWIVT